MRTFVLTAVITVLATPFALAGERDSITVESVLHSMNAQRLAEGLHPLVIDERLAAAASDRMRHMEEEAYWSHESPAGLTPFVWVRMRAYDFRKVGENLAAGFETSQVLMDSWMESPGHRANIISPDYEDCGIAIIDGSTRGPARGRSVVVLFGEKRVTVEAVVTRTVQRLPGGGL